MLALQPAKRRGYTHDAMARGEVMRDFVEAVASDPETALARVGIQTKHLSLEQYPNSHVFFNRERYEDFLAVVQWVPEVEPREHDATAVALIMRLREGKHSSDVFKSTYVFVTRNAKFVRTSRKYCVESGLINEIQQGPLIHQRELATVTWLRTGLGEEDNKIPLSHLLATCDRILQIRTEVPQAVARTLREVTPEKIEQFEMLLQDHRSIRKLADETLNDENVVTAENAEHLFNVMRLATVEEERSKFEKDLSEAQARHREAQRKSQERARLAETSRDDALGLAVRLRSQQSAIVTGIVGSLNSVLKLIDQFVSGAMLVLVLIAIFQNFFGWPSESKLFKVLLDAAALLGAYHLVTGLLGKPMVNLTALLNLIAPILLERRLDQLNVDHVSMADFQFKAGRVIYQPKDGVAAG